MRNEIEGWNVYLKLLNGLKNYTFLQPHETNKNNKILFKTNKPLSIFHSLKTLFINVIEKQESETLYNLCNNNKINYNN